MKFKAWGVEPQSRNLCFFIMEENKSIAISITTHNRYDVFKETLTQIVKFAPKGAKIIIVDDGSDIPVKEADFRFETAQGIAAAKNKALELMGDADYYFCFDDDVYPKVNDWHLPYINSGLNHLCFTFGHISNLGVNGRVKIKEEDGITYWKEPCGLMLFFTKKCLDMVGGMDTSYGKWGYEHVQLSMRIFNNGLTHYPFMDVANSMDLFTSLDQLDCKFERSVDLKTRQHLAKINQLKYLKDKNSKAYIPFKEAKGVVLTTYLTGCVDPQRGQKWDADIEQVRTLAESVKRNNTELVLINDCFDQKETDNLGVISRLPWSTHDNPYFLRWKAYREYLKTHEQDNVWLVDATDTELLRHSFKSIQPGKLYVGWEKEHIGCKWLINHHKSNFSQIFIKCNMKTPLLNAGVIGGRYEIVMEFLDRICDMISILPELYNEDTDMALFNWVLYSHFNGRFISGDTVTTEFKKFKDNGKAIWRHK